MRLFLSLTPKSKLKLKKINSRVECMCNECVCVREGRPVTESRGEINDNFISDQLNSLIDVFIPAPFVRYYSPRSMSIYGQFSLSLSLLSVPSRKWLQFRQFSVAVCPFPFQLQLLSTMPMFFVSILLLLLLLFLSLLSARFTFLK